ncbi:MAG: amidohydrolase [Clostridia bacterium]|nr:amidohydrolase [Clostridia bacterium]
MYPVIDSHCHIYPDKIAERATAATGDFYHISIEYDGKVSTLKRESEKAGINFCIVQSVATTPQQVSSINRFIAESTAENKCFAGLGTLHPESENQERDVNEIISLGLKGVKLHPDIQGFRIDDDRCFKIYELCEKKGLPILMHTGDCRYDYSNPDRLIPVLENFYRLIIVGAHFGGWSVWKAAARQLHGYNNLYVDTSSSLYALKPEEAREIISLYTEDRVLFGTDFPMWNQSEEMNRYKALNLSPEQNEKILYRNACRVFKLDI